MTAEQLFGRLAARLDQALLPPETTFVFADSAVKSCFQGQGRGCSQCLHLLRQRTSVGPAPDIRSGLEPLRYTFVWSPRERVPSSGVCHRVSGQFRNALVIEVH